MLSKILSRSSLLNKNLNVRKYCELPKKNMFIKHKFELPEDLIEKVHKLKPNFGHSGLGELVYYRTYSRKKEDGRPEGWNDTILRVSSGLFSILKSHMIEHHLPWDQEYWTKYSKEFTEYMFDMKFMPSGRNLWIMGTKYVEERGGLALNNCGFVSTENLVESVVWTANALMSGCGIGFDTKFKGLITCPKNKITYVVPDSREGWSESIGELIKSYLNYNDNEPVFDYSQIRPSGTVLKGFGGTSAGADPLIKLHKRIETYLICMIIKQISNNVNDNASASELEESCSKIDILFNKIKREIGKEYYDYAFIAAEKYSNVRLVVDIFNAIGACIVSGNIRRSSEIALGSPSDDDFIHLKDLDKNPERSDIYWMSNNTVVFESNEDFKKYIPKIAKRIVEGSNGEPGIYNKLNVQKFGRVNYYDTEDIPKKKPIKLNKLGQPIIDKDELKVDKSYAYNPKHSRELEEDKAWGVNPCGEVVLESYELCNLSEVFPSKCVDKKGEFSDEVFYKAVEYATFYASVVSLLPTDSPQTNAVVSRNHRIGVSLSGTVLVSEKLGYSYMIELLKSGYKKVRETNNKTMDMAGVARSLRVTTIKPSGSISQLPGTPSGIHFPIEDRYIIRRVRVAENSDIVPFLIKNNIPYEKDKYSDNTLVFSFPVDQGCVRSIKNVSMWEQLEIAKLFQRYWSDNSVSVTINYDKNEAKNLEEAIALNIGSIKTLSFAPKSELKYEQQPIESISYEKYLELKEKIGEFDLSEYKELGTEDTTRPNYCDGGTCAL